MTQSRSSTRHILAGLLLVASLGACAADESAALGKLNVDAKRISVAGLSSGAYMATQSQLAWPERFSAAALVAGGPWGCADGDLMVALGSCMKGSPAPDIPALVARAQARSTKGDIGPLAALGGSKVYVLHGSADGVVAANVGKDAAGFYEALRAAMPALKGLQVTYDGKRDFGHNLPVAGKGDDCALSQAPFLGHCGFDAAQAIFEDFYGKPAHAVADAGGELRSFAQKPYEAEGKPALLADNGYVYVPKSCAAGKACGVMVVFHGCKQNAEAIGETFVRDAGFNRWADAYDVAVLYPQTKASFAPLNPQACWDWWGYSGADYDSRSGAQQQWLINALTALGVAKPD